jgi:hypothetical protein
VMPGVRRNNPAKCGVEGKRRICYEKSNAMVMHRSLDLLYRRCLRVFMVSWP